MPTNQDPLTRLDRALIGILMAAPEAAERIEHWRTIWVGFDPKGLRGHRRPLVRLLRRAEANLAARRDPEGRRLRARRLRQQGVLVQSLRKVVAAPDPAVDLLRHQGDDRAALAQSLELLHEAIAQARAASRDAAPCLDLEPTPLTERISANIEADLVRLTSLFPTHRRFARHEHGSVVDRSNLRPLLERLRLARERLLPAMVAWYRFERGQWFKEQFGIPKERLQSARRTGRLTAIMIGGEHRYSVIGAHTCWPRDVTYPPI